MSNTCDKCVYSVTELVNREMVMLCKRYPPQVSAVGHAGGVGVMVLPVQVTKQNTCGEFKEKPKPIALVN